MHLQYNVLSAILHDALGAGLLAELRHYNLSPFV